MNQEEIANRLNAWKKRYWAMMAQLESLQKLTGADWDSPMLESILQVWDAYTVAVSEQVGDQAGWLNYYQNECDMGNKPKETRATHGVPFIKLGTVKQLAKIIKDTA